MFPLAGSPRVGTLVVGNTPTNSAVAPSFSPGSYCCFFYASGVFAAHVRAAGLVYAQSVADGLKSQSAD